MRTKRTELTAILSCLLVLALPGAGRAAVTAHVHVLDTVPIPSFDPAEVVILVGDTVEWDNHTERLHTVTDVKCKRADARNDGSQCVFDSIFDMTPGTTWTPPVTPDRPIVFHSPMVIDYKCTIHGFNGRITVLGEPGALPNLTITGLAAYDTTLRTSKRLEATVANTGDAPSAQTKILFQYRNIDGSWIDIGEPSMPVVNPGGTVTINQDWPTFDKIGDFPVRGIVDSSRTQIETNESDNQREIIVPVLLPQGILPGIGPPELS